METTAKSRQLFEDLEEYVVVPVNWEDEPTNIACLPPKVLHRIFLFGVLSDTTKRHPFSYPRDRFLVCKPFASLVSRVCISWRELVQHLPSLWVFVVRLTGGIMDAISQCSVMDRMVSQPKEIDLILLVNDSGKDAMFKYCDDFVQKRRLQVILIALQKISSLAYRLTDVVIDVRNYQVTLALLKVFFPTQRMINLSRLQSLEFFSRKYCFRELESLNPALGAPLLSRLALYNIPALVHIQPCLTALQLDFPEAISWDSVASLLSSASASLQYLALKLKQIIIPSKVLRKAVNLPILKSLIVCLFGWSTVQLFSLLHAPKLAELLTHVCDSSSSPHILPNPKIVSLSFPALRRLTWSGMNERTCAYLIWFLNCTAAKLDLHLLRFRYYDGPTKRPLSIRERIFLNPPRRFLGLLSILQEEEDLGVLKQTLVQAMVGYRAVITETFGDDGGELRRMQFYRSNPPSPFRCLHLPSPEPISCDAPHFMIKDRAEDRDADPEDMLRKTCRVRHRQVILKMIG